MGRLVLILCISSSLTATARAAPVVYRLDRAHSRIVIHVRKAGALSAALHDHAFVPGRWRGEVSFDPVHPATARGEVVVDAGSLRDEEPGLSASDRAKVESQVRGPSVLDVARYPEVRLEVTGLGVASSGVQGELTAVTVLGTLFLHGRTSPVRIPLQGRWTATRLEGKGALRFDQSTFGIKRLHKLFGAIAVRDELLLDIEVRGEAQTASPP